MDRPSQPDLAARLFGASPERTLALLRAVWPAAVGSRLARRTEVVAFDGGLLRIRVPDAGWRRQLVRMRADILTRIRRIAGGVAPHALGFVEGPVAAPAPADAPPEVPASPVAAPHDVAAAAESITDPELRARFLAAAGRYLRRFGPRAKGPPDARGSHR